MAVYRFQRNERPKNSNVPVSYTILTSEGGVRGSLTKRRNNWRLDWEGTGSDHATRLSVQRHLTILGHRVEGLL